MCQIQVIALPIASLYQIRQMKCLKRALLFRGRGDVVVGELKVCGSTPNPCHTVATVLFP